jgi:hypothetical protein
MVKLYVELFLGELSMKELHAFLTNVQIPPACSDYHRKGKVSIQGGVCRRDGYGQNRLALNGLLLAWLLLGLRIIPSFVKCQISSLTSLVLAEVLTRHEQTSPDTTRRVKLWRWPSESVWQT